RCRPGGRAARHRQAAGITGSTPLAGDNDQLMLVIVGVSLNCGSQTAERRSILRLEHRLVNAEVTPRPPVDSVTWVHQSCDPFPPRLVPLSQRSSWPHLRQASALRPSRGSTGPSRRTV